MASKRSPVNTTVPKRYLLPYRPGISLIPLWARCLMAVGGLTVATIRTIQEYRPPFDESTILRDPERLYYIYSIAKQMGLPAETAKKLIIVVGEHNGLQGSLRSKPGPILELSPQLSESLNRRTQSDVQQNGDVALALRVKKFEETRTKSIIPLLIEFPFEVERRAVIAHELAHLQLDHASGLLRLNALMAFCSFAFLLRPGLTMIPIAFYLFSQRLYSQHCELAADRAACTSLGPDITRAMINRLEAQQKLDSIVLGKYSWDDTAFLDVVSGKIWNELFHVTLEKRVKNLKEILAEQTKSKKKNL